jgi:hypothetical protein
MRKNNLPRIGTIWIHHITLNNIKVVETGCEPFDFVRFVYWFGGKVGDRYYSFGLEIVPSSHTVTLCEFLSLFTRNKIEEED